MSQAGVYSESKMAWWFARDQKLPDAPKQVQVIVSDLCNQDCNFCAYRMSGYTSNELFVGDSPLAASGHSNPVRFMDTERALRLMDEIRALGSLSVQFTGGGEPTVHPHHEMIFSKALANGLRCALVSNGIKWRPRLFELLPRFDWVRVSIDAGTAETYAKIRRVPAAQFARAIGNIETLAKSIGKYPTALGVGYVVTPDNWQELRLGAKVAKEAGAHSLRLSAMFSPDDERPFIDIYDRVVNDIRHARDLYEDDTFVIYDNFGSRFHDLRQHSPDYRTCAYQYYTTYIGGDFKVYRCCVLAYNRRGLIKGGDISTRPFDEYWRSQDRVDDFGDFDARGCPRCQFNAKNRELLYVAGNTEADVTPRHMEWP